MLLFINLCNSQVVVIKVVVIKNKNKGIKIYLQICTLTLIYPSQISHITNVFFPPDFEEVPDPGMEVWDVVRGNGVIDILGWLNSFAVGFLGLAVVFWKT